MFRGDVWARGNQIVAFPQAFVKANSVNNTCESMFVAFWKYVVMQDNLWNVVLRKDVHVQYDQDVMLYKDWPIQAAKLSHFATIHELKISGVLVFSTICRWKITEMLHSTGILERKIIKLSRSMSIGECSVTHTKRFCVHLRMHILWRVRCKIMTHCKVSEVSSFVHSY